MNQQQQQVYINLIQELLNCRSHDEIQRTLTKNQDLINVDFLRVLEVAAEVKLEAGQETVANRLRNLRDQLVNSPNLKFKGFQQAEKEESAEEDLQDYFRLLIEVTYVILMSNGDSKVVYPLLQANIDKLDNNFVRACRWSKGTFEREEPDVAEFSVGIMGEFGNLIAQFPLGKKSINIEIAIACYEMVLEVRTQQGSPQEWATTQINLGNAYRNRVKGDKSENIENAISSCKGALKVYTQQDHPQEWAKTQVVLGNAYSNRIKGDEAENIENAIALYKGALQVYTQQDHPQEWAATQGNLGSVYGRKAYISTKKEDIVENTRNAISAFSSASTVFNLEEFSQHWAKLQNNLGLVYHDTLGEERSENLEQAITAYQNALKVRTFDAYPHEWAITQNNLGRAYCDRIEEDKIENLERSIAAYQNALKVRTFDTYPTEYVQSLWGLGIAYQKSNQLNLAYSTFESAIVMTELLRDEIVSGEESKRKQAEVWTGLYNRMVEVCLKVGSVTEALEYAERSKTRSLVEQILKVDAKAIFPAAVTTQLENYRDEIATGQDQIQNGKVENPEALTRHLQRLRQQKNELQNSYLPVGYAFKFDSFHATLDNRTAIIEWYILDDKILAFIIKYETREITIWQSQPEDREALYDWTRQYLRSYYSQKDDWQKNLGEELKELASILHIDEILAQIPNQYDKLILVPNRFLHLFPLHAIPVDQNSENSPCLLDLFPGGVSYAPSCQLLQQLQKRQRPNLQSLFAIQNPTEDLNYTDLEVQVIQAYFNSAHVLKKTLATLTAINTSNLSAYHCVHFSCHGYFNLADSSKSALILANAHIVGTTEKYNSERYLNIRLGETHDLDKCLTLDKIFSLKLDKCRLVTLSACETGLIDFGNTSDEYIGLPSGFLSAGSPSVVSSLWKVDDLSTSFLMIEFYENLFKSDVLEAGDVSIALKKAQTWLRNLTTEELDRFLEKHKPQTEKVLAQLRKGQQLRFEESLRLIKQRQPQPFANPYYWAGFTASGR